MPKGTLPGLLLGPHRGHGPPLFERKGPGAPMANITSLMAESEIWGF